MKSTPVAEDANDFEVEEGAFEECVHGEDEAEARQTALERRRLGLLDKIHPTAGMAMQTISLEASVAEPRYGFTFWAIFAGLALTAMVSALDGSIVSTALPTIVRDLQAGDNYVWIINAYFLTR
ncbi:hypothetical protein GP486_000380 [Trichoglossum hirsutum]|uniref:Major facilitator superfamily (MFS) profile domain-containing protein n=1 Tax=Trichoglossum hirsutum TaxID=265104 RepID=A0A9P8RTM4_9PEZI|nr:hypothetical protein GP486_000380 [Trichoglossum hirsutum]